MKMNAKIKNKRKNVSKRPQSAVPNRRSRDTSPTNYRAQDNQMEGNEK